DLRFPRLAPAVAGEGPRASRADERKRNLLPRADPDRVHAIAGLAEHGERLPQLVAVVLAVRHEEKHLLRGPIVLLDHLGRALERGADVRAEQRIGIAVDPVEIEEDALDVAGEVREDDRRIREADERDAIDRVRLVL